MHEDHRRDQSDHQPAGVPAERAPDLSILTRVEGELAEVQQALGRLDEGRYGECRACGGPIGDDRLESHPATALCAQHASG